MNFIYLCTRNRYNPITLKSMDIKIEGNPGTGNSFTEIHQEINIGTVQNYNNGPSTIHNYYTIDEESKVKKLKKTTMVDASDGHKPSDSSTMQLDQMEKPEEDIDISAIRSEILHYVNRVRPLVHPEKRDRYMKMWEGILDLDAVRPFVYKTGKQKRTNFNRKLIANILHHLDTHHIYTDPYKASSLALALEGDYEMSVRGELGKYPSEQVCAEIDEYLETLGL